ncbi:MAG: LamB/YcsF family protein [Saprospirales bacterium]|nr:LamB/YcsF family protein [Saprospirales bacterium]MBK8921645.1 LamB/YcsF family protein [Saprospirales bacterium]
MKIDLNCDLGEGYPNDAELMALISSANIACGYHAGDADTMRRCVGWAVQYGVAIGAHPGFADRENFGRTEVLLPAQGYYDLVFEQLAVLDTAARAAGAALHHVKPHGALYNMATRDPELACAVAQAVLDFNPKLILYGLSGSVSISEAERLGLRTASEVFADRGYQPDGTLMLRAQPGALITEPEKCRQQVLQMVLQHTVTAVGGARAPVRPETVCLHGDGPHAVAFARALRAFLQEYKIDIHAP